MPRLDLLRRRLRVEQQLITVQGRAPFFAPPETAASVRQHPLPGTMVDAVAAHLDAFEPGVLGTVFSGENGEPLRRNRFSERVGRPAVAQAGLGPGTRFQELRHFYASLLIRHGESVKTVQARGGPAGIKVLVKGLMTVSRPVGGEKARTKSPAGALRKNVP